MKNLTRKLFISIFTAVFALVALGTTTYAWFTVSYQGSITEFEGTVKAGDGIEIAITQVGENPSAWYVGQVPAAVLKGIVDAQNVLFDAVTLVSQQTSTAKLLTPFSGWNEKNAIFKKFLYPGYENKEVADAILANHTHVQEPYAKRGTQSDYIAFDIHIRYTGQKTSTSLVLLDYIELTNTTLPANLKAWTNDATGYKLAADESIAPKLGDMYEFDILSAVRVGLISATVQNHHGYIFENEEVDAEEATPVVAGKAGNSTGLVKAYGSNPTTIGSLGYLNIKQSALYTAIKALDNTEATYDNIKIVSGGRYNNPQAYGQPENELVNFGPIADGLHTTIRCFVWIEGWDAECMVPIFGQTVGVQLGFKVNSN